MYQEEKVIAFCCCFSKLKYTSSRQPKKLKFSNQGILKLSWKAQLGFRCPNFYQVFCCCFVIASPTITVGVSSRNYFCLSYFLSTPQPHTKTVTIAARRAGLILISNTFCLQEPRPHSDQLSIPNFVSCMTNFQFHFVLYSNLVKHNIFIPM